MYKAIFFDISGVLYEGKQSIPGAIEAIAAMKASGVEMRFVTNTSRKNCVQIYQDLDSMGFAIEPSQIFTAPAAVKALLHQRQWRPYCLIHRNIESEFEDIEQSDPNVVFIADAEERLCYESLDRAFRLCQAGAPLIAVGMNRYFKQGGRLHLDAGPFIRAIEYAADTKAIIAGKPSVDFFAQVVASTQFEAEAVLMIGDDVFGDVEGALNAGLDACLVRTGKYLPGDENRIDRDFCCVDSVAEAVALVMKAQH